MKKTLLFLVGMTAANFAYAQLYFQLKGGYAFRAAPSLVGEFRTLMAIISSIMVFKSKRGTRKRK